jgi:hypothetical protein
MYEPMVIFCSKWVVSSIFMYFWRAPTCGYVSKNAQGLKGKAPKKKIILPIESWVFTFIWFYFLLRFYWHHPQCIVLIWMWGFYIFTSSIVLEFWVKTLVNKKNSNSLIFINLRLRFDWCVLNLIWTWCAKAKKKEYYLIFMNFGVKKFTIQNIQKIKTPWCLDVIILWIPWNDKP